MTIKAVNIFHGKCEPTLELFRTSYLVLFRFWVSVFWVRKLLFCRITVERLKITLDFLKTSKKSCIINECHPSPSWVFLGKNRVIQVIRTNFADTDFLEIKFSSLISKKLCSQNWYELLVCTCFRKNLIHTF